MYPLRFNKVLREKIWGGRLLEEILDIDLPTDQKYGESWELCSRVTGVSRVMNGPLKGKDLEELYQEYKEKLVGDAIYQEFPNRFPLLVKHLDLEGLISIRVHPSDEYALKHEEDYGKAKCWYVLYASDDAKVIMGVSKGITPESFIEKSKNEDFDGLFNIMPVKKGDLIDIPPGTVYGTHAGEVVVCEIQQNSSTKYRLYDYNRDRTGKKIDIESAAEVLLFDHTPVVTTPETRETYMMGSNQIQELIRNKYFNVDHIVVNGHLMAEEYINFKVLTIIDGQGSLISKDDSYPLKKGDTYFIPAKVRVEIEGHVELLKSFL